MQAAWHLHPRLNTCRRVCLGAEGMMLFPLEKTRGQGRGCSRGTKTVVSVLGFFIPCFESKFSRFAIRWVWQVWVKVRFWYQVIFRISKKSKKPSCLVAVFSYSKGEFKTQLRSEGVSTSRSVACIFFDHPRWTARAAPLALGSACSLKDQRCGNGVPPWPTEHHERPSWKLVWLRFFSRLKFIWFSNTFFLLGGVLLQTLIWFSNNYSIWFYLVLLVG